MVSGAGSIEGLRVKALPQAQHCVASAPPFLKRKSSSVFETNRRKGLVRLVSEANRGTEIEAITQLA